MYALQSWDLPGRVRSHPYQSLLVAAGVGYVLGGGLFTRLTLRVLQVGARLATIPLVQREILAVAEAALNPPRTTLS